MRSMARGFPNNPPCTLLKPSQSVEVSPGRPLKGEVQLAVGRWATACGRGEGVRPRRPRGNITPSRYVSARDLPTHGPPWLWARADAARRAGFPLDKIEQTYYTIIRRQKAR